MSCHQNNTAPMVVSFEDFLKREDSCKVSKHLRKPFQRKKLKRTKKLEVKPESLEVICVEDETLSETSKRNVKDVLMLSSKRGERKTKCDKQSTLSFNKKRKKNEDNDVVEVIDLIQPLKKNIPTFFNKQNKVCEKAVPSSAISSNLTSSSEPQWTEKYCPTSSKDIIIGRKVIDEFMSWLCTWKDQIEKERQKLLLLEENEKKYRSYDEDEDFCLSKEDFAEDDDSLSKVFMVAGPYSSCKTSSVHACAHQAGFKVLEVNASMDRSGKSLTSQLREATQSHLLSKQEVFKPTAKVTSSNSLKNFFSLNNKTKKRGSQAPSSDASLILIDEVEAALDCDKNFWNGVNYLATVTKRPIVITSTLGSVRRELGMKFDEVDVEMPAKSDLMKCLKKIAQAENILLSRDQCGDLIGACRYDVRQAILTLQFWGTRLCCADSTPSPLSNIQSLLFGVPQPLGTSASPLDVVLSHLYLHNLTSEIAKLLMSTSDHVTGNTSLAITSHPGESSSSWADGDSEGELLSLAYNRRQPATVELTPQAHTLPPSQSDPQVDGSLAELNRLSASYEVMSAGDQLLGGFSSLYPDHSWSTGNPRPLDGVLDELGDYPEVESFTEDLFANVVSSLQAHAIGVNSTPFRPTDPPSKLYLDLELRFRDSPDLHLDILPALRSICRMEERRRKEKSRRFLHYLDSVGFDFPPCTSLLLSQEYHFVS